ncbi:MAG: hypothetical protein IJ809_06155 [Clostridia bacterium]|nr:hypothetical protein [Clostridia bacterium]
MRKLIMLFISLILIGGGVFFIKKISTDFDTTLEVQNGELEFEYDTITSLHTPADDTKIITKLNDLKYVVEGHNFNVKHSYIYVRFNSDNKHAYTLKQVEKTTSKIYVTIETRNLPQNENIELIESFKEYIIDIIGNLEEDTPIVVNLVAQDE